MSVQTPRTPVITTGYTVYDREGYHVGVVDDIKHTPDTTLTAQAVPDTSDDSTLSRKLFRAFAGEDELARKVRLRLLRNGYIRIARGSYRQKGYVAMDQINRIEGGCVRLAIAEEEIFSLP